MSRTVGKIKFRDGQEKFCIHHNTASVVCPFLCDSEADIDELFNKCEYVDWEIDQEEIKKAEEDEEPIYVYQFCNTAEEYLFTSLASRTKNLITASLQGVDYSFDWVDLSEKLEIAYKKCQGRVIQLNKVGFYPCMGDVEITFLITDTTNAQTKLLDSNFFESAYLECNISPDIDLFFIEEKMISDKILRFFKRKNFQIKEEIISWEKNEDDTVVRKN